MSLPPRPQLPPPVIRTEPPFKPNSRPAGRFSFLYATRGADADEPTWDGWPRYGRRALAATLALNALLVTVWWFFDAGTRRIAADAPAAPSPASSAASAPASAPSGVEFFQPIIVRRP